MGYNGSNRGRSNRGYKGFPKSSNRKVNSVLFGRKGLFTNFLVGATKSSSKSSRRNSTSTSYNLPYQNSSDKDGLYGAIFVLIVSLLILILGLTGTWWFGLCYFFSAIGLFLSSIVIITEITITPLRCFLFSIPLFLFGLLPFQVNVYSSISTLIIIEGIVFILLGLFLSGYGFNLIFNRKKAGKEQKQ